jgi:hypothetical protein
MPYTTEELIKILDRELKANWKGERVLLSCSDRIDIPVIAKALDLEKVGKVFAYRDFRQQVHDYQRDHQVSGLVWRKVSFEGNSVCYPEVHNQLIAIAEDKNTLIRTKQSVLTFWRNATENMSMWLAGSPPQKTTIEYVEKLANDAEWLEVDVGLTEVHLGACWGNPQEYRYQWAKPKSGCHRIIASHTEPSKIKIY